MTAQAREMISSNKQWIAAIVIVLIIMTVMVGGVAYAYIVMGPTTEWSVLSAVAAAFAVTTASLVVSGLHLSRVHGSIRNDLVESSKKFQEGLLESSMKFQDHFEKTITAIKTDGEETRKALLAAHKPIKEKPSRKE